MDKPGTLTLLNEQQKQTALAAMRDYLSAPAGEDGLTPAQREIGLDAARVKLIEGVLGSLIAGYLEGCGASET